MDLKTIFVLPIFLANIVLQKALAGYIRSPDAQRPYKHDVRYKPDRPPLQREKYGKEEKRKFYNRIPEHELQMVEALELFLKSITCHLKTASVKYYKSKKSRHDGSSVENAGKPEYTEEETHNIPLAQLLDILHKYNKLEREENEAIPHDATILHKEKNVSDLVDNTVRSGAEIPDDVFYPGYSRHDNTSDYRALKRDNPYFNHDPGGSRHPNIAKSQEKHLARSDGSDDDDDGGGSYTPESRRRAEDIPLNSNAPDNLRHPVYGRVGQQYKSPYNPGRFRPSGGIYRSGY